MKKRLLSQAAAWCLLGAAGSFVTLPAGAAADPAGTAAAAAPQTRGLEVNADSGLAPGSQLRLTLEGSPGGQAQARIPGPNLVVPLREVAAGQYIGHYTVRRTDRIDPSAVIRVSLTAGTRTTFANYTFPPSFMAPVAAVPAQPTVSAQAPVIVQPLVRDNRPPQIGNLMPRQGEAVSSGPTLVSGTFDDAGGAGVDPRSVRIVVSGRDVTSLASITPREFSWQDQLPPGQHTVEVSAGDRAGNVARKSWSFDVGSSVLGSAPAILPLMVTSHPNNAQIDESVTTIRGRTAPGATVHVRVDAILPPVDRRNGAGVAELLLEQALQADANGDFSFTFNPRYIRDNASSLPVPGTRYEVSITANRDSQTAGSRLMLFQRG